MTRKINMFKGITLPMQCKEGKIDIVDSVSVTGDKSVVVLANPVAQGDAVVLTGEMLVEKADGSNGAVFGFVGDHPEFDNDPRTDYTQAQALSAGVLRKAGIETVYNDVRTVPAKASEAIEAGMFVEFGADGFEKTASSGTTESNCLALTDQNTDDEVVIAIK